MVSAVIDLISRTGLAFLGSDKRFTLVKASPETKSPLLTCVVPVFNQERIIQDHLTSLLENAIHPIEVIVVNDSSNDGTELQVLDFISSFDAFSQKNHSIKLFTTKFPMFESRCEDFAFRIARGDYLISLQADMKILEWGFDKILIESLSSHEDLELISCRGTHSFADLGSENVLRGRELSDGLNKSYIMRPFAILRHKTRLLISIYLKKFCNQSQCLCERPTTTPRDSDQLSQFRLDYTEVFPDDLNSSAGWLGSKIDFLPYEFDRDFSNRLATYHSRVWFGETVMRGPLFMKRKTYIEVGGFDIEAFYQGLDDHDFSARLAALGKKVGFSPIYFSAPLYLGVARQKKTLKQRLVSEFHVRIRRKAFLHSALIGRINTGKN